MIHVVAEPRHTTFNNRQIPLHVAHDKSSAYRCERPVHTCDVSPRKRVWHCLLVVPVADVGIIVQLRDPEEGTADEVCGQHDLQDQLGDLGRQSSWGDQGEDK